MGRCWSSPMSDAFTFPYWSTCAGIVLKTSVFPRRHMFTMSAMSNGASAVCDTTCGESAGLPTLVTIGSIDVR